MNYPKIDVQQPQLGGKKSVRGGLRGKNNGYFFLLCPLSRSNLWGPDNQGCPGPLNWGVGVEGHAVRIIEKKRLNPIYLLSGNFLAPPNLRPHGQPVSHWVVPHHLL